MDYSLAKELYDAGFRREGFGKHPLEDRPLTEEEWINCISCTDLEELIEACGEKLVLTKLPSIPWHAANGVGSHIDTWATAKGEGKTPTEAVARLYLALHPKQ